jgi:hypothetical protein
MAMGGNGRPGGSSDVLAGDGTGSVVRWIGQHRFRSLGGELGNGELRQWRNGRRKCRRADGHRDRKNDHAKDDGTARPGDGNGA